MILVTATVMLGDSCRLAVVSSGYASVVARWQRFASHILTAIHKHKALMAVVVALFVHTMQHSNFSVSEQGA